jgi:hypothetical protein
VAAEVALGLADVAVGKKGELGVGKAAGVNKASVNRTIDDNQVAGTGERGDSSKVGHVPAGKKEGGLSTDERGETDLQHEVFGHSSTRET